MQITVSFDCNMQESKKAINTVENVSEILAASTVSFSKLKKVGHPAIFVNFPNSEKSVFVALYDKNDTYFAETQMQSFGDWKTAYPCRTNPDELAQDYVFEHLTDAAEIMVREWIVFLCNEYESRINADQYESAQFTMKIEQI